MTQYSTEFKTKIVLEVLAGDKTINEIASEHNIIPKNIILRGAGSQLEKDIFRECTNGNGAIKSYQGIQR